MPPTPHNHAQPDTPEVTNARLPPVSLGPMSDADFMAFAAATIPAYAANKVESGQWSEQECLKRARKEFEALLPQGRLTAGHHLFNAVDEEGRIVGTLWLARREQADRDIAYLYDLWIRPEWRRQGYATSALEAAEAEARTLGLSGIGLHVFGHNAGARRLYEKLGYRITNLNLFKPV